MAIQPCRECGREISSEAASCPNCGAPLSPPATAPPARNKVMGDMDVVRAIGTVAILSLALFSCAKCIG